MSHGKLLRSNSQVLNVPASVRAYKILRLLPQEGGEPLYRIKTIAEAFERIAKESELVRSLPM
jgi:hypothetical protein